MPQKVEKAIYIDHHLLERFNELMEKQDFSRVYYGNEFCENLVPRPNELKQVFKKARQKDLNFTLLTPWATNSGLKSLKKLFQLLPKKTEIVFNDWGTFKLINEFNRKESKGFKKILGRLLIFHFRDPRIKKNKGQELISHFQNSNLANKEFQRFLTGNGVFRAELDNTFQGYKLFLEHSKIKTSLYYPFVFIGAGTSCAYKSTPEVCLCHLECKKGYFKNHFPGFNIDIFDRGNAQFYLNGHRPNEELSNLWNVDRTVFFPKLP